MTEDKEDKAGQVEPTVAANPADQPVDASGYASFLSSRLDWLLIACLLGLAPLLYVHFRNLWSRQHFQFFPVAIAAFVWLIYSRAKIEDTRSKPRGRSGLLCLVAALGVGGVALGLFSPWMAHMSLILACLGWLLLRAGGTGWGTVVAWSALLVVWLPPPSNLDTTFVQQLQSISTKSASSLLDLTSVPHFTFGNVLELKTGKLFVDDACSGVDSLYALTASVLLLTIWGGKAFLPSLIALMLAPVWAWMGNTIRIFSIAYLLNTAGIDLSHGWMHTLLGMCIFGGVLFFAISTCSALELMLEPMRVKSDMMTWGHEFYNKIVNWPKSKSGKASKKSKESTQSSESFVLSDAKLVQYGSVVGIGLMLLVGVTTVLPILKIGPWSTVFAGLPEIPQTTVVGTFGLEDLPENLSGLERKTFGTERRDRGSVYGEHSAVWEFSHNGYPVLISVDFPFPGYHTLEGCYELTGYVLREPATRVQSPVDVPIALQETTMTDQMQGVSYLCFAIFDQQGKPEEQPEALKRGIWGSGFIPITFQIQIFARGCGVLTDDERIFYRKILTEAYQKLLPHVQELQWES